MSDTHTPDPLEPNAERFKALDATREAFKDVPEEELEAEVAKALASARRQIREERAKLRSA